MPSQNQYDEDALSLRLLQREVAAFQREVDRQFQDVTRQVRSVEDKVDKLSGNMAKLSESWLAVLSVRKFIIALIALIVTILTGVSLFRALLNSGLR